MPRKFDENDFIITKKYEPDMKAMVKALRIVLNSGKKKTGA